ncbi:MAG: hypothetical protein ACFB10_11190 [Salibacteraceae bacterium]
MESSAQVPESYPSTFSRLKASHQPEALLISWRENQSYRSLLLHFDGTTMQKPVEMGYLATPQPDRWYFIQRIGETHYRLDTVGQNQRVRVESFIEDLIVEPRPEGLVERVLDGNHRDAVPYCGPCRVWYEEEYFGITWLSPGLVTIRAHGNGYMGGSRGYNFDGMYTRPFGVIPMRADTVEAGANAKSAMRAMNFENYFGPSQWDSIRRELYFRGVEGRFIDSHRPPTYVGAFNLASYKGKAIGSSSSVYQVDPNLPDLVLYHHEGRVHLKVRAHTPAEYKESLDHELTVEVDCGPLKPSHLAYNECPVNFNLIERTTGAKDVYIGPGRNFALLVFNDMVQVVRIPTGELLYRKFIDSELIMAEWKAGEGVLEWLKILPQY